MLLIMKRSAAKKRRAFMSMLGNYPIGDIIDLEFDNDNDELITAEPLDWHLSRKHPHLT